MTNHPNRNVFARIAREARETATYGGRFHEKMWEDQARVLLEQAGKTLPYTAVPDGDDLRSLDNMAAWLRHNVL